MESGESKLTPGSNRAGQRQARERDDEAHDRTPQQLAPAAPPVPHELDLDAVELDQPLQRAHASAFTGSVYEPPTVFRLDPTAIDAVVVGMCAW